MAEPGAPSGSEVHVGSADQGGSRLHSGFVAVIGRPNVGKSSLVNTLVGQKVSITASTPNTTRTQIRGVAHLPGLQIVFVDTPGIHRPKSALGHRLNESASASLDLVDAVVCVVDATGGIGPGDLRTLEAGLGARPAPLYVVVNKVDKAKGDDVLIRLATAKSHVDELARAKGLDPEEVAVEYFPVSARTGAGTEALLARLAACMPPGPPYYPEGMVSDETEAGHLSELVREQLLRHVREELPHAIACRVVEWDWPVIEVEIIVERDSQKAIVIGHRGEVLKQVGIAVRQELPDGTFLKLTVKVEADWQRRNDALDRLGY